MEFGAHGTGGVEDEADGEGSIFTGESRDLLFGFVLEELEVFGFEAGDEAVERVGDGDVDEDEVRVDANGGGAGGERIGLIGRAGFAARGGGGVAFGGGSL